MDIGKPKRTIRIEPIENPVPERKPVPVRVPQRKPAETPEREPAKVPEKAGV